MAYEEGESFLEFRDLLFCQRVGLHDMAGQQSSFKQHHALHNVGQQALSG